MSRFMLCHHVLLLSEYSVYHTLRSLAVVHMCVGLCQSNCFAVVSYVKTFQLRAHRHTDTLSPIPTKEECNQFHCLSSFLKFCCCFVSFRLAVVFFFFRLFCCLQIATGLICQSNSFESSFIRSLRFVSLLHCLS